MVLLLIFYDYCHRVSHYCYYRHCHVLNFCCDYDYDCYDYSCGCWVGWDRFRSRVDRRGRDWCWSYPIDHLRWIRLIIFGSGLVAFFTYCFRGDCLSGYCFWCGSMLFRVMRIRIGSGFYWYWTLWFLRVTEIIWFQEWGISIWESCRILRECLLHRLITNICNCCCWLRLWIYPYCQKYLKRVMFVWGIMIVGWGIMIFGRYLVFISSSRRGHLVIRWAKLSGCRDIVFFISTLFLRLLSFQVGVVIVVDRSSFV